MIRGTLAGYFSFIFLRWILGLFAGSLLLVMMLDLLELMRVASESEGAGLGSLVLISALRVPALMEEVLPFLVLLGSIAAFMELSRRMELVVTRAAGLSVWQFAAPGLAVAVVIGIVGTLGYNPLATALKLKADEMAADTLGSVQNVLEQSTADAWLREAGAGAEIILHADTLTGGGRELVAPIFWRYGPDGRLAARIEAARATLEDGAWRLEDAQVAAPNADPVRHAEYELPTALTPIQVRESFAAASEISFWQLPAHLELARAAGLPATRFRLQFQSLLARPLLLAAMVLIAATVSLGLARFGNQARRILGGIGAGFLLYVLTQLSRDIGGAGLVPPAVAAWAPAVVAAMLGVTVLLYREDG